MAASAKKRKAQALEEDSSLPNRKRKSGAKKQVNGGKMSSVENNGHITENGEMFATQNEEAMFTVKCPSASGAALKKQKAKLDLFGPAAEDGGYQQLAINYTITPGSEWANLRQYRNFIVGEQKFSMGETVFINHSANVPQTIPENPDDLAFDRANNWIAKVLEVRAKDPQHVYLRVFWLYWPEELPHGREHYHGEGEVVMSNHMEVVDAMTVAARAEVTRWNELDADEEMGQLFWRQFFDVREKGKLSEARRHCICNDHYNPDKTLLKCPSSTCGLWLHEECLIEDVLEKTYKRLVEGESTVNGEVKTSEPIPTKKSFFPAEKIKELASNASSKFLKKGNKPESEKKGRKKSKSLKSESDDDSEIRPWEGLFTATINKSAESEKQGRFEITDLRGEDPKTWYEEIHCLKCDSVLD